MCFRSKRYYERKIKDLQEEVKACNAVIRSQEKRMFELTISEREHIELYNKLRDENKKLMQDRDEWSDIAHQVDAARREMLRRYKDGTGEYDTKREYNTGVCSVRTEFDSVDSYL